MKTSQLVFACHEKACAPPPAGHGGSSPAGQAYRATKAAYDKMSPEARGRIDERLKAKAKHKKVPTGLAQDGTTNTANPGGLGGGSVGRRTGSEYTNSEALNTVRRRLAAQEAEAQRKAKAAAKIKPTYSKKNPPPGDPLKNHPRIKHKTRYNYSDND